MHTEFYLKVHPQFNLFKGNHQVSSQRVSLQHVSKNMFFPHKIVVFLFFRTPHLKNKSFVFLEIGAFVSEITAFVMSL